MKKLEDLSWEELLEATSHKQTITEILLENRRPELGGKKQLGNCNLNKWKESNRDEFIKHASLGNKSRKTNGHAPTKPILVYKDDVLIKEYDSISSCGRDMNLDKGTIQRVCKGKYKQYKGYVFKYKD